MTTQLPYTAAFTDYNEMLDRVDLDAVDITLPYSGHANAVVAAVCTQIRPTKGDR